jgi:hypothetical protein
MIVYPSIFLSHNSADKPIVEAVARELGRRGVLPWLEDLDPGMTLTKALSEAIRNQTAVAVFLSPNSIGSPWVDSELEFAFQVEEREHRNDVVIPVCLGDELDLIKSQPRLQRLLHPDGERINRIWIAPDAKETNAMAGSVAAKLAESIFRTVKVKDYSDVMIYVDQRGNGQRLGIPGDIPPNLGNDLDVVGLVFRPDLGTRTQNETLHSQEWDDVCEAMEDGLSRALCGPRWPNQKRIYVLGNGQTALFHLLGLHFNRNTSARLYCSNANQAVLSNKSQPPGASQLEGGDAYCDHACENAPSLLAGSKQETVSLLLGTQKYVAPVQQYLAAVSDSSPLVWIQSEWFKDSSDTMKYIANVVALLSRLRSEYSVRTVRLFNTLPIHTVPLIAANLLNEMDNIIFMEYRRDLQGKNPDPSETYVELKMY